MSIGTLIVSRKGVYGRDVFYPVNETALLFAKTEATKTITPRVMAIARKLGFEVKCEGNGALLEAALNRIEFK